ncbi:hypothetical protein [Chroococcus sp. FPU101]|uniref:hypothetical protein n=1 Tax=Chroococcus sp. FPU101 TaxID=1974212 RepID=UPI001A8CE617|nr:hypothetical protein [Chroococcus sp. FPU101]
MKVQWQKLLLTVTFWLATEVCFNFLEIDVIANYSEFLSNQKVSYLATNSFSS